jgi:hypothetical protein
MHPRYSSITLFFSPILLFAGIHGASAEAPLQAGTNSTTTDGIPVSTETTTLLYPTSPAAQEELKMCRVFGGCLRGNLQRNRGLK